MTTNSRYPHLLNWPPSGGATWFGFELAGAGILEDELSYDELSYLEVICLDLKNFGWSDPFHHEGFG